MFTDEADELRWMMSVLRRWLWLIAGCAALFAASAFLIGSQMTLVYSASISLLIDQASTTGRGEYSAIRASERLAGTYSQMLVARPVLEATIARLELAETPEELAKKTSVKPVRDTQLIELSVRDADPARAAQIADAISATFIDQNQTRQAARYAGSLAGMEARLSELSLLIQQTQAGIDALPDQEGSPEDLARLENVLAGYRNTYATVQQNYEQMRLTAARSSDNVIVVEEAQVPLRPVAPRSLRNALLAGLLGALLALGLAFLLEYADDAIRTPKDVRQALGLDTLATIAPLHKGEGELVAAALPPSPAAEAFQELSTKVLFSFAANGGTGTLLVTSPGRGEGKTVTAANLAVALSQAGLAVAAVDVDLRHPRLHQLFRLHPGRKGLCNALSNGDINGDLQLAYAEGVQVLPAGAPPTNLTATLESPKLRELLRELALRTDLVLIDSPPILAAADAVVLARRVDGVLLVLEAGRTRRDDAQEALQSLRRVRANVIGVALNAGPAELGSHASTGMLARFAGSVTRPTGSRAGSQGN